MALHGHTGCGFSRQYGRKNSPYHAMRRYTFHVMTAPAYNPRRQESRRRFWIWAMFLCCCTVAGSLRVWQNQQHRQAIAAWQNRCNQLASFDQQRQEQIVAFYRTADNYAALASSMPSATPSTEYDHKKRPTIDQFERLFNNGQPLKLIRGQNSDPKWTDPMTGRVWELSFREGRLHGYGTSRPHVQPPQPVPTNFDQLTEAIRSGLVEKGVFGGAIPAFTLWALMLPTYAVWKTRRCTVAQIMLGLTILSIVAGLVSPAHSTIPGSLLNQTLGWGLFMLATSVSLLAIAWRVSEASPDPLCTQCGYNLTGNVSGICPECGTPASVELRKKSTGNALLDEPAGLSRRSSNTRIVSRRERPRG